MPTSTQPRRRRSSKNRPGRGDSGHGKGRLAIDVGDSDRSTGAEERKIDADGADIHVIISGEHGIGGNERVERFTKSTTREASAGFADVVASDEHDIDVAIELQVLKSIVQHVNRRVERMFRQASREVAIGRNAAPRRPSERTSEHQAVRPPHGANRCGSHPDRERRPRRRPAAFVDSPRLRIAGRSPSASRSRTMDATIGVFPRPPAARLPTLMTGRRNRRRRSGTARVALAASAHDRRIQVTDIRHSELRPSTPRRSLASRFAAAPFAWLASLHSSRLLSRAGVDRDWRAGSRIPDHGSRYLTPV